MTITAISVRTFVGTSSLSGSIDYLGFDDLGIDAIGVEDRMAIATVEPEAQIVGNSAYMALAVCGQPIRTAAEDSFYMEWWWIYSGALCFASLSAAVIIMIVKRAAQNKLG